MILRFVFGLSVAKNPLNFKNKHEVQRVSCALGMGAF